MKSFEHISPDYCDPPGSFVEIIPHPIMKDTKAIEQATFKEHRFSFFFWLKWYRKLEEAKKISASPTLISIDYHRDLAGPNNNEKKELLKTTSYNLSELANFCWAQMNPLNNGHILSAAYLNIVGDVILLRQETAGSNDTDQSDFEDFNENRHNVHEFRSVNEFESFVVNYRTDHIFFDIDLDYFIEDVGDYMNGTGYRTMSEEDISAIIDPSRPFLKKIYQHLEGFTVATEQKHCGGIINSSIILCTIERQLFSGGKNWK